LALTTRELARKQDHLLMLLSTTAEERIIYTRRPLNLMAWTTPPRWCGLDEKHTAGRESLHAADRRRERHWRPVEIKTLSVLRAPTSSGPPAPLRAGCRQCVLCWGGRCRCAH